MTIEPTRLHILTYAQTLRGGGVELAMLRLAAGWIAAGHRVTLVVGAAEGPLMANVPAGVERVAIGSRRYLAMLALPVIVRRRCPDILFCPGNHYTAVAAWTALWLRGSRPPIVGKVSNAPDRADHGRLFAAGYRAWMALHGRFLDHAVAMTAATGVAAAAAMRMAGRISVIANPPAMPHPPAHPGVPAAPPVVATDRPYILGVGRLVVQKRWDRLVAAIPRLARRDIVLAILGDGPERPALQAQAAALGVADRVLLPGHAADPFPAMTHACVLALPSEYEGVPGVLREALSVGTPVVATRSSVAVDEIVTDASLGSIVDCDDQDALVVALDHWLADDVVRPAPVVPPGADSAARYLALFHSLVTA
ncbi:glycosyltransferase [Sphingomonas bacterium]|uniref:glycosyltransferase n=1 Tax=Sphingomonas bacterium TaxID=1895847 RepID=UPI0015766F2B|nr:glycosyltransferase [Sphingomonas bacterium]